MVSLKLAADHGQDIHLSGIGEFSFRLEKFQFQFKEIPEQAEVVRQPRREVIFLMGPNFSYRHLL